jgi:hypothetical protein
MSEKLSRKNFILSGTWDEATASVLDDLLKALVNNQVAIRTGSYIGTGKAMAIPVNDLPGPPKVVLIQNDAGTITGPVLAPLASLAVTAWNQNGFTVGAGAAYNTATKAYAFLVIA